MSKRNSGDAEVSLIKLPRLRGVGVSPLKKNTKYSGIWFDVSHKEALYHENVLNEKLVKLKYESCRKVYYIDKAVTMISIK